MSRSAAAVTDQEYQGNRRKGDTKPMSLRFYAISCLLVFGTIPPGSKTAPLSESGPKGIDVAAMDKSVAPGDDFYTYGNGAWLKATSIPPDKASYGIFTILSDENAQTHGNADPGGGYPIEPEPRRAEDRRLLREFYGRGGHRDERNRAAQTPARHDRCHRRPPCPRACNRWQPPRDVDALNSTNFYTGHLFGVWVTQGLEDPRTAIRI